ncbi:squamosa promoter-binding-like protein 14 isoform X2 [Silene latifolia]|uniref:squamosa promoter-binding-like protein 14 isoform X2 n=1 Tax=Silene latifolia TaxID=37657 RepID=UPI003D784AB2
MEELGLGTQVAAPLFIHQNMAGRLFEGGLIGQKRGYGYNTPTTYQKQQHSQVERTRDGWDPKQWEWDSARFVARARPLVPEVLGLGTPNVGPLDNSEVSVVDPVLQASTASWSSTSHDEGGQNGNCPQLQLGSAHVSSNKTSGEEPVTSLRPNKKVRSGSPGNAGTYPVCQVDCCEEDLSKAKDYHRRHKVCELHSKATKAIVGKQMQRFCQQCSRFHPLAEFDEGKRSCRRRLAGHNRRRRKTQPEEAIPPVVHPTAISSTGNGNLDIVNLLTVLARGQGIADKNVPNYPSMPDKSQLIEILSKLNNVLPRPTDLPPSPAVTSGPSKNIFEQTAFCGNKAGQNNMGQNMHSLGGGERSSSSYQSPTEDSDGQLHDTRIILPLQLFSSSPGNDSPRNVVSSNKFFSSNSCSPSDERSHSSSTPITRTLFPLETTSEIDKADRMSICEETNVNVEACQAGTFASGVTLELFGRGNMAAGNKLQSLPNQAGYSSSGSDHSPPSFNSDPQDRTGRIMFKLFDKDPGHFPGALRTQICNWLSNSPTEMESFIRPGCVVLSVYVSMPSAAWEKLEENFSQQLANLVQNSDAEFWRNGRFSVNIGRQLAFHKGGKFNFCKPWSIPNSPEMVMVSPLAVVSGQTTSLVIRGRNLTSTGTKIHCTYMGGYSSKEVSGSTYQGCTYDEIRLGDFRVHAATSTLGRCFIEVENGVRGNSFPIIIADAKICQELRLLEQEFDKEAKPDSVIIGEPFTNISSPGSHEEILCFLNELGWLFQRQSSSDVGTHDFSPRRYQYLLTFSIERDYCALVKTLLDIFTEKDYRTDGLSSECLDALEKTNLLHRAVKKRSKRMVDMLIHYSPPHGNGASNRYIFPPNLSGPGGITPLHLAACSSGSYDIVDVLTDDPMEIGLHSWKSLLDYNGQSPSAYATMRNDHSLNSLVAQKLVDRRNNQLSVSIEIDTVEPEVKQRSSLQINKKPDSCPKCAMMSYSRMSGSQGMLHRPLIHSMLAIAAVCVCVCLFFKSMSVPLTWENLDFGSM